MTTVHTNSLLRRHAATVVLAAAFLAPSARAAFHTGQSADFAIGLKLLPENSFVKPGGVAVDPVSGKVYVSDTNAGRVLRFSSAQAAITGGKAEAVFGQPDMDSLAQQSIVSATTMNHPRGLCVDSIGNLYVADTGNNRVLRFANAGTLSSGPAATSVLGQTDFTTSHNWSLEIPYSVRVDTLGHVWVADTGNHRVVRYNVPAAWINGAQHSASLTGSPGNSLSFPRGLSVTGNGTPGQPWVVWVADTLNHRVLYYYNPQSTVNAPFKALGQEDLMGEQPSGGPGGFWNPTAVAQDAAGRLYVADEKHNRVLRFDNANQLAPGADAVAVLGQEDFVTVAAGISSNQMDQPMDLCVNGNSLFVADWGNRRVLRFANAAIVPNGGGPTNIIGQHSNAGTASVSSAVIGEGKDLAVDPVSGKLFVADRMWHRVLRYTSVTTLQAGGGPEAVFGQPHTVSGDPGTGANKMQFPAGVAVDGAGRLWVSDSGNGRVLRFDNAATALSGVAANGVLGQDHFNATGPGTLADRLNSPAGLHVDAAGRLWVADAGNHRVLRFDDAAAKPNGAPADGVLGQANFTTLNQGTSSTTMRSPQGVALTADGRLYVADRSNNRVLRFDGAATKPNGAAANFVYGQGDYFSSDPSQARLTLPEKVAVHPVNGALWVADTGNSRAAGWKTPLSAGLGTSPDVVLGQDSLQGSLSADNSLRHTINPAALAFDAYGCLWMADTGNKRVLRFSPSAVPVTISLFAQQKILLTIDTDAGQIYEVWTSTDLTNWAKQGNNVNGIAGSIVWTDPMPLAARKFYKVIGL